jgi:hypothetical protein
MAETEFNLSVSALQAVGCVSDPTSERESHLTPFGMELLKVCSPPKAA